MVQVKRGVYRRFGLVNGELGELSAPAYKEWTPLLVLDRSGTQMLVVKRDKLALVAKSGVIRSFQGRKSPLAIALGEKRVFGLFRGGRELGDSHDMLLCWDAESATLIRELEVPVASTLAASATHLGLAGKGRMISLYDQDLNLVRSFRAHDAPITALTFHPREAVIASAAQDLSMRIWNTETGERLSTRIGPPGVIRSLAFNASGDHLACSAEDMSIWVWSLAPEHER